MEVVAGRIISAEPGYLTVRVPYTDTERFIRRQYDEVQVGLEDGRTIAPEQRRKAYALMGEIAEWSGETPERVKLTTKHDFVEQHLQGLKKELFSLASCDMTTAREFISYLIDFCIEFEVPTKECLALRSEDIPRYIYACLMHKRCAVCGKPCDLHHVDRVGMGRDREEINHVGMLCLPLCRVHHKEAHDNGDEALMDTYHLEAVEITEKVAKLYKLNQNKEDTQNG